MAVILSIARWDLRRAQAKYRDLFLDIGIVIGCYAFISIVAYLWNLFSAPGPSALIKNDP